MAKHPKRKKTRKLATSTASVADIPDDELLKRAVGNARGLSMRKGYKHWRWVAVQDAFALGSTYSAQLCRRFGFDPFELVKR